MELLTGCDTLAVNFAANTDEFMGIRPRYYLLMDPHFFSLPSSDPNVTRLYTRLDSEVDWEMTLFIPTGRKPSALGINNHHIHIEQFNPVGVEGYDWLVKSMRLRPRTAASTQRAHSRHHDRHMARIQGNIPARSRP